MGKRTAHLHIQQKRAEGAALFFLSEVNDEISNCT